MATQQRILLLLLLVSCALASQSSSAEINEDEDFSLEKTNEAPQTAQRRSGYFHSGLGYHHHHVPATGFAYSKSFYSPVLKYPVFKTFAATPVLHHHRPVHTYASALPHYHLQHGGASVSSYNVNFPRYPLLRPVLKVPVPVKPTVFSAPAPSFVLPQKPIIPVAVNPVLPTAARPLVYPQPALNPAILAGLNPQLIPISVSNGAVFANYPTLAPTPIAPSVWRPIAVPTVPTVAVQRPSISILPPLGAPSSTVATLADPVPVHHHHHQFAQHVPTTTTTVLSDSVDQHQHQHHHLFGAGGKFNELKVFVFRDN